VSNIDGILKHGRWLFRGLIKDQAPNIFKGIFIELLADVSVKEASDWVLDGYNLLDRLPEKYRIQINEFNMGTLEWFTPEWCIENLKEARPELSSLFLGWKKGNNWLQRQCIDIQDQLGTKRVITTS